MKKDDVVYLRHILDAIHTKRLSDEIREKYPEIPWMKMVGMRDKLIHDYIGVDIDAVRDTVERDIPQLNEQIKGMIEKENYKLNLQ